MFRDKDLRFLEPLVHVCVSWQILCMVYSKSWQLSPLEICAVAPFSFGLPKVPVYYAKCLPLPGKSEMLGKMKPQVPFGLVPPL